MTEPLPQYKMPDYKEPNTNPNDLSSWVEIQPYDINPPAFLGSPTTVKTTLPPEQMKRTSSGANSSNTEPFVESLDFTNDAPSGLTATSPDITNSNLKKNWVEMVGDKKYDMSNNVVNPYGYGYVPSLEETRNTDALDLYQQENATFVIGAITGVSLIVLGILLAANSPATE
jgi:hypothetical protein